MLIDLSHRITDGMITYPGLPAPVIGTHLSREAAEELYGPGITFHIGLLTICTNTGTYIDVPFHRYADGHDLADLALEQVASLPAVVLDRPESRPSSSRRPSFADSKVTPCSYAPTTRHFGTDRYFEAHPHLSASSAEALVAANVSCVGIDSLNIDGTKTGERPVHSILLRAGIPIVEHLTNLSALPGEGFEFTAVPPKIEGAGTFTVRAFAATDLTRRADR